MILPPCFFTFQILADDGDFFQKSRACNFNDTADCFVLMREKLKRVCPNFSQLSVNYFNPTDHYHKRLAAEMTWAGTGYTQAKCQKTT
jgi:hypothetical protein